MIIQYPTGDVRPYYDRNSIDVSIFFDGDAIAPHAQNNRVVYTVPANRKAVVTSGIVRLMRETVATTAGWFRSWIVKNLFGTPQYLIDLKSISNSIGAYYAQDVTPMLFLVAGDTIHITTMDGSTAGAVAYHISVIITEFDA